MFIQKVKNVIAQQLSQGTTPHDIALTFALALFLGLIPLLGTTTTLCILFAWMFKLNQPLIQLLNYVFYPLQLIGIPTFLYIGESILQSPHTTIYPTEMATQFFADWKLFFVKYGMAGLHALLAWIIIAPILSIGLYFIVRPIVEKLKKKVA